MQSQLVEVQFLSSLYNMTAVSCTSGYSVAKNTLPIIHLLRPCVVPQTSPALPSLDPNGDGKEESGPLCLSKRDELVFQGSCSGPQPVLVCPFLCLYDSNWGCWSLLAVLGLRAAPWLTNSFWLWAFASPPRRSAPDPTIGSLHSGLWLTSYGNSIRIHPLTS